MAQIQVTAPGKLMLFGEHAAVYGYPCIVTAVNQCLTLTLNSRDDNKFSLDAPDVSLINYVKDFFQVGLGDIPKAAQIIESAISVFNDVYPLKNGIALTTKCGFNPAYGLGSSSATAVITIASLAKLAQKNLVKSQIFNLSFSAVRKIQPNNSGFDVAAAIWGGTILYQINQEVVPLSFLTHDTEVSLIVGFTGIKADTPTLIEQVAQKRVQNPQVVGRIFAAITDIVNQVQIAIGKADYETVGKLMNFNQDYLRNLGVSSEKLEALIYAAKNTGAYGAKLSGAGGGDCMIAIAPNDKVDAIKQAIKSAGGEPLDISIDAPGVSV
jgi:mevalonate kinase